jgi:hypothetical protein
MLMSNPFVYSFTNGDSTIKGGCAKIREFDVVATSTSLDQYFFLTLKILTIVYHFVVFRRCTVIPFESFQSLPAYFGASNLEVKQC